MKAAKVLDEVHSAQCMNYLKATGLKVCLLVNFSRPRVDIKRIVLIFEICVYLRLSAAD